MSIATADAPITFYSHALPLTVNQFGIAVCESFTARAGVAPSELAPRGFSGPVSGNWVPTVDGQAQITAETFTSRKFACTVTELVTVAVQLRNEERLTATSVSVRIRVKHGNSWGQSTTTTVNFGPAEIARREAVSKKLSIADGDILEVHITASSGYTYPQTLAKNVAVAFVESIAFCGDVSEGHLSGFFATPGTLAAVASNPIAGGGVVTGANVPGPRPVTYVLNFAGVGREDIGNEIARLNRILSAGDVAVDNHGLGYTVGGFLAAPAEVEWLGEQRTVARVSFTLTFTDPRVWADDWQSPAFLTHFLLAIQNNEPIWASVTGPASLAGGTSVYTANPSATLTLVATLREAEFKGAPAPLFVGQTAVPLSISLQNWNAVEVATARFVPSTALTNRAFALDMERGLVLNIDGVADAASMLVTSGNWRMRIGDEYKAIVTCNTGYSTKICSKWWGVRD